jgi:RNA-directed DNA polymerase
LQGVCPHQLKLVADTRRLQPANSPPGDSAAGPSSCSRVRSRQFRVAKTYRNLWPQLVSWGNLVRAYQLCRRGKRAKADAARFDFAWEANLLELQQELNDGPYQPGAYRHFFIHDPKRRKISAAPFRDRVVHHAVVNVLTPLYEPCFAFDSYACRRGKGTHRALRRAQHFLRRHAYFLKTDLVKFFPGVDHAVLLAVLARGQTDGRLLDLLRRIVASGAGVLDEEGAPGFFPGDDLFAVLRPRGLPIGNLTSQFFANVLLDPVDHFVKEELRLPGYVRYYDDLVLFGDSKEMLRQAHRRLSDRLAAMRLRLHRDKTTLRPSRCGLKILGFVVWPEERRLQQGALRRINRRLRRWRWQRSQGLATGGDLARTLRAWWAHARHGNARGWMLARPAGR